MRPPCQDNLQEITIHQHESTSPQLQQSPLGIYFLKLLLRSYQRKRRKIKNLFFSLKTIQMFQEKISLTIQDQKRIDKVLIFITTWMNLENSRPSEVRQTRKDNMV